MRHTMRYLLTLLVLAAPLAAQTPVRFSQTEGTYANGPTSVRFGYSTPPGTTGGSVWMGHGVAGTVAVYDLRRVTKGGYDFDGTDDWLTSSNGAVPRPSYPFWIAVHVRVDVAGQHILSFYNSGATANRMNLWARSGGGVDRAFTWLRVNGANDVRQDTQATAYTIGRWHRVFIQVVDNTTVGIYCDVFATHAGTELVNGGAEPVDLSAVDTLRIGADHNGAGDFDGRVADLVVGTGVWSEGQRLAYLQESVDPAVLSGATIIHRWKLDNALTPSVGEATLTVGSGTPTAQNEVLALRGGMGAAYNYYATTAPPTWSSSAFNGQGGLVFSGSQFLLRDTVSSAPHGITGAPLQVFAVAAADNTTADHTVWWTGPNNANSFRLLMAGAQTGDPVRWAVNASGEAVADTSTSYSAATNYLLWGLETSTTSRTVQRDAGGQGTNSTNKSPTSPTRSALGGSENGGTTNRLAGHVGFVWLLNTSSTADKARIERMLAISRGLGF